MTLFHYILYLHFLNKGMVCEIIILDIWKQQRKILIRFFILFTALMLFNMRVIIFNFLIMINNYISFYSRFSWLYTNASDIWREKIITLKSSKIDNYPKKFSPDVIYTIRSKWFSKSKIYGCFSTYPLIVSQKINLRQLTFRYKILDDKPSLPSICTWEP